MELALYITILILGTVFLFVSVFPTKRTEFYQVLASLLGTFLWQYLGYASFMIDPRDVWMASFAEIIFVSMLIIFLYRLLNFFTSWREMKRSALKEAKELDN